MLSRIASLPIALLGCTLYGTASAASTCGPSEDIHTITSKIVAGATISYKETFICETTPGVRSFSGYVNIPSHALDGFGGANSEYNASMFFWYFESRNDPENSPLSLYLGGGPGASSLADATSGNGPCHINSDSNSTTVNQWSWNNNVNMLYVDQPVQVGFSYDKHVPSILDLFTGAITPSNGSEASSPTAVKGVLPSQDLSSTANTTVNAAKILWQFSQIWLNDFHEHRSSDDRVSIWSNSYGGHWGPGAMAHFQSQNEKLQSGALEKDSALHLNLDTLGITNGCIDAKIEAPFYLEYAVNNTYDLRAIPDDVYIDACTNLTKEGGCDQMIDQCHALAAADPENVGTNETVNAACASATQFCFQFVQGAFTAVSGRNPFDISRDTQSVFPPNYVIGFLNQDWVQRELGVPLNFTISSNSVLNSFFGVTGDPLRVTIDAINYVAESGIKVALVYGDRDYRCNWLGGEAVSLAMSHRSASDFRSAGYQPVFTTSHYRGGVVRQHNKISFSRILDAGHSPGAYQPETVSNIFDRVMFDRDVATGSIDTALSTSYSSIGPARSFGIKNVLPPSPKNECYLWDAAISCTEGELLAIANGTAVLKDFILVSS